MPTLLDTRQRPLRDLRISVTDRCNLRCTYCMPRAIFNDKYVFLARQELLSFEEILHVARIFTELGVQKIRLTGGEPLLRRGIEQLIAQLAQLTTPDGQAIELTLTTNGVLLANKALALKNAGLHRITVSLDGLSQATFEKMSDSQIAVSEILHAIEHSQTIGFVPIKVNMVVKRGVNDHEILPMAEHFRHSGIILRFIEYMDVGNSNGWQMQQVVSAQEILQRIHSHYPLQNMDANYQGEVAERWQYLDGAGEIGVIASVTQAFCHSCSRIRLSTDGKLFNCLFGQQGLDLRPHLRQNTEESVLKQHIQQYWQQRDDHYSEIRHLATPKNKIEMSYIGG